MGVYGCGVVCVCVYGHGVVCVCGVWVCMGVRVCMHACMVWWVWRVVGVACVCGVVGVGMCAIHPVIDSVFSHASISQTYAPCLDAHASISQTYAPCLDARVVSVHEMLCVFVYIWPNAF